MYSIKGQDFNSNEYSKRYFERKAQWGNLTPFNSETGSRAGSASKKEFAVERSIARLENGTFKKLNPEVRAMIEPTDEEKLYGITKKNKIDVLKALGESNSVFKLCSKSHYAFGLRLLLGDKYFRYQSLMARAQKADERGDLKEKDKLEGMASAELNYLVTAFFRLGEFTYGKSPEAVINVQQNFNGGNDFEELHRKILEKNDVVLE